MILMPIYVLVELLHQIVDMNRQVISRICYVELYHLLILLSHMLEQDNSINIFSNDGSALRKQKPVGLETPFQMTHREILNDFKQCFIQLENDIRVEVRRGNVQASKLRDNLEVKRVCKLSKKDFARKLEYLIDHLTHSNEMCEKQLVKHRRMLQFLIKLYLHHNKQAFLARAKPLFKQAVYRLFVRNRNLKLAQKPEDWLERLIEEYRDAPVERVQDDDEASNEIEPDPAPEPPKFVDPQVLLNTKIIEYENKFADKFVSSFNEVEMEIQNNQQPDKEQAKAKAYGLKVKTSRCPERMCRAIMVDRKCTKGNHLIVFCHRCKWHEHTCKEEETEIPLSQFWNEIEIEGHGPRFKTYELTSIPKLKYKNNIRQYLEELNYCMIQRPKFIPGTYSKISCSYPILPKEICMEIYRNRQDEEYLPLTIRESSIPNAGLGVFTRAEIETEGMLVCSYLGEIGIGSLVPVTRLRKGQMLPNDSFFTLGWFKGEILVMAPNKFSNVGRFINYNTEDKCNLKPSLCLLETPDDQLEIAVFLTSTRRIKEGEELFYNYGEQYTDK